MYIWCVCEIFERSRHCFFKRWIFRNFPLPEDSIRNECLRWIMMCDKSHSFQFFALHFSCYHTFNIQIILSVWWTCLIFQKNYVFLLSFFDIFHQTLLLYSETTLKTSFARPTTRSTSFSHTLFIGKTSNNATFARRHIFRKDLIEPTHLEEYGTYSTYLKRWACFSTLSLTTTLCLFNASASNNNGG